MQKKLNFKFRTRLQAACLIIVSAYIHFQTQIPDPLVVLSLGLLRRYNQLWSHIAHVRPIRTLQLTVKLA